MRDLLTFTSNHQQMQQYQQDSTLPTQASGTASTSHRCRLLALHWPVTSNKVTTETSMLANQRTKRLHSNRNSQPSDCCFVICCRIRLFFFLCLLSEMSHSALCSLEAESSIAEELKMWVGGCEMGIVLIIFTVEAGEWVLKAAN